MSNKKINEGLKRSLFSFNSTMKIGFDNLIEMLEEEFELNSKFCERILETIDENLLGTITKTLSDIYDICIKSNLKSKKQEKKS